jgi:hypothetical protein
MAYDSVRILINALSRAQIAQPARLSAELTAQQEYPAVTGPLSLVDRRAKRKLYVTAIQGGEAKVVRMFGPGLE